LALELNWLDEVAAVMVVFMALVLLSCTSLGFFCTKWNAWWQFLHVWIFA